MSVATAAEQHVHVAEDLAGAATAPARWLLETASDGGVPLTQTHALARIVVREAAERWPGWWDADLFGVPHREADMALLGELREGLLRKRLIRRRGSKLLATAKGRKLAGDPIALLYELALDLGGGDLFTSMVAGVIVDELDENASRTHDQLVAPAHEASQWGWRDPDGNPPSELGVSWVVSDVLCRGEAYGLIERKPDPERPKSWRALISLSPAAALVLGRRRTHVSGRTVFVFEASLLNVDAVSARVAVAGHEHLTELHGAIQQAFNWEDDHLYSFWLDGEFWGDAAAERVIPGAPDTDSRTADVPIESLRLEPGGRIAYVFDYGDEWRVMLTLRERLDGGDHVPRVADRQGTAPPQYPPLEEPWPES
jgi:Plasmid pRiA4b ORF-3-like protein